MAEVAGGVSDSVMRIAVLITCHNRKALTLNCLKTLHANVAALRHGEIDVFLVDDGSTDGTSAAVEEFCRTVRPALRVHLVKGSGRDYWARGMERAWIAAGSGFDFYWWLNDDVTLQPDALERLLTAGGWGANGRADGRGACVAVGTLVDGTGEAVYGLNVRNVGLAGNCVLVPRAVYEKMGMICGRFAHGWADRDYGLRVERAGFALVSAGVVGTCNWHEMRPSLKGLGLEARIRLLGEPKGWNVHDLWLLRARNWGFCAAFVSCAHLILHVLWGER